MKTDEPSGIADGALGDVFRRVFSRCASGVWIISARAGGIDHGITATSVCSASLRPPLVLCAIHRDSRLREALSTSDLWAATLLSTHGRSAAEWLAEPGRPALGQFDPIPFDRGLSTGAPIPRASLGSIECRTSDVHRAGDHDVLIGQVLACSAPPLTPVDSGSLLYRRRRFVDLP